MFFPEAKILYSGDSTNLCLIFSLLIVLILNEIGFCGDKAMRKISFVFEPDIRVV